MQTQMTWRTWPERDGGPPDGGLEGALARQALETRTVLLFGEVTPEAAARVSEQLLLLAARSQADIRLMINAEGGRVAEGEALFDVARGVGARVITVGAGAVAGAAALAYAAPPREQRLALPHARFSLAQRFGTGAADVLREAEMVAEQRARVAALLARQTGQTEAAARQEVERGGWRGAEEARGWGLVGKIVTGNL
jgi:ATP-dependent Clp protease protease subunit